MNIMHERGSELKSESGQAMVEFALVLPLLALLLFGIIQYGFIFNAYMTLRHAAHQTARSLSLPLSDTSSGNAKSIACSNIVPTLDCANLGTPGVATNVVVDGKPAIRVDLTYTLPLIVSFVVPNSTSNALSISATATYRKEG